MQHTWLEKLGVNLIRKKVEDIDISFFNKLSERDILFIDSSHIIKPDGDTIYECLHILPSLNKNVFIHIHDIFTPFNYPDKWVIDKISFWNEQYLIEAFLSYNNEFEILSALNFLYWKSPEQLKSYLKSLNVYPAHEPSSLWLIRK